jgi:hypothetical protein
MSERLCLCGCGLPVLTRYRPSRYMGFRRGHCRRVAQPELVSADPVLRVLSNHPSPKMVVAQALGILPDSARRLIARWDGGRMRRSTAERILRFVADLPRQPTKRQMEATRRQIDRERKAEWRARQSEARTA